MTRRRTARVPPHVVAVLAVTLGAACRAPTRASPAPADVGYPRCLAFDAAGSSVACRAPQRTYDGDACVCADGDGHAFYGRVQERPR